VDERSPLRASRRRNLVPDQGRQQQDRPRDLPAVPGASRMSRILTVAGRQPVGDMGWHEHERPLRAAPRTTTRTGGGSMTLYYADEYVTLHHGDALEVLRQLPGESLNCCITSPPYFGLRDYEQNGQYGLESSPAEYVETMRALFAE